MLVSVVAVGYRSPEQANTTGVAAVAATTADSTTQSPQKTAVNDVVATDIAASVAQTTALAVAPNVAELAASTRVQSEFQSASSDSSTISKPAIVELSSASRNITTYPAQAGDTVQTVAAKYNLSADTIRWANNLTSDAIAAGSNLQILPVDGIVYTVKDGDTIEKISEKYKGDVSLITTYNDLELGGVTAGLKIIIPNGVLPTEERPGYVAPVTQQTYSSSSSSSNGTFFTGYSSGFSGGKTWFISRGIGSAGTYAYGNCTSYAFWRRAQLGRPVGTSWGNAGTWAYYARLAGYTVDRTPAAGAVIQDAGHVAIVEAVLPNGDLQISEMNASVAGGGYNIVSGRILSAGQVGQYYYIH